MIAAFSDVVDGIIFSLCFTKTVLLVPPHITLNGLFGWSWSPEAFTRTRTELCKRWFEYTSRSLCLFCAEQINAYVDCCTVLFIYFYFFIVWTQYISYKHLIVRNSNNQHHILGLCTMELRNLELWLRRYALYGQPSPNVVTWASIPQITSTKSPCCIH